MASTFFDRARGMFARDEPPAANKASRLVAKKATQTFHAVTIQPGRLCCHEARAPANVAAEFFLPGRQTAVWLGPP